MGEEDPWDQGTVPFTYKDQDRVAVHQFQKPLFEYLVSGLDAENKWVRIMAAAMLGSLGHPGAARHLKPLAIGADADLRTVSQRSLRVLSGSSSLPGSAEPDACGGCMIRIIAEEALACRKKTGPDLQWVPPQAASNGGSPAPDLLPDH